MKAKIFEIKRFAVHDGDGIRTTVFFKGCPMRCLWCHNPEGLSDKPQLGYYQHKCISCGECVAACPAGAHSIKNGLHAFAREKCVACGKCEKACLTGALVFYGKEMTVEELLPVLLADKDFYDNSGGGVTLSGGECLIQADFCAELLKRLKENGVNTAVDTCGFINKDAIDKVMPYTDIFLFDIKAIDEAAHIKCTGRSNKIVLENLTYIDDFGGKIQIRIPFVPGYNDGEIKKAAKVLSALKNVTGVRVLPYHNYAGTKYESLQLKNTLPKRLPTEEELARAEETLKSYGLNVLS